MRGVEIVKHGVVCSRPDSRFGYFGWPSIARLGNGTLVAGASGLRMGHLCPFGKTTLFFSRDEGETWTCPVVVNDTPLDDRDVGLLSLGGQKLLLSWFNLESRYYSRETGFFRTACGLTDDEYALALALTERYPDAIDEKWAGSYTRVSCDGGVTWGPAHRSPVTAPHGPILREDGALLYVGKEYGKKEGDGEIAAHLSRDEGATWEKLGVLPVPEGTALHNFHEPHAIDLGGGRIRALIRYQDYGRQNAHPDQFSMAQSVSADGGSTWSEMTLLSVSGSPPHLIRDASGALVCVYARREAPFSERAMVSRDGGATWETDLILREACDGDIGYPASVALADGSILTVYYQHLTPGDKASILSTRWRLF